MGSSFQLVSEMLFVSHLLDLVRSSVCAIHQYNMTHWSHYVAFSHSPALSFHRAHYTQPCISHSRSTPRGVFHKCAWRRLLSPWQAESWALNVWWMCLCSKESTCVCILMAVILQCDICQLVQSFSWFLALFLWLPLIYWILFYCRLSCTCILMVPSELRPS